MRKIILSLFFCITTLTTLFAQINTDRVMTIGRNALYFEDYVLSIQYFNQIIKVKPYLAEPYFYRAIAKISLEDYQGAMEDAGMCIERNPFIVNAYQVRGIARQNLEQYDGAIEDYTQGLAYAPENKTFLLNKAIAYAQKKDYDHSSESFETLIRIHPSFYNAYMSRSAMLMEKGDTIQAVADLDKAIAIDKHSAYAYAQRAMVKSALQNFKPALEDMNQAIRLEPDFSNFYINRGLIRYHLEDLRGAMQDYDRVIELDKNNKIAYYNRGLLRSYVGDRNRAISDFSQVIRLEPDNYFAYYNRAVLRDETGDFRGAVKDYTAVLDEYPRFLPGLYARSEAKRKMNDLKGGEADFMAAYKLEKELLAEREARRNNPDLAKNEDSEEESASGQKGGTRKESDKNIAKFNRILVTDNENNKSKYKSDVRGRVQDNNVNIELAGSFILSYYEKGEQVRQSVYFDRQISDFNKMNLLNKRLRPTSEEAPLTSDQADEHFASIDNYSRLIEISPNNPLPYFGRSMDFMLVQDFQSAVNDLNATLAIKDNFVLGYFNRAAVRMKQLETGKYKSEQADTDENIQMKLNLATAFDAKLTRKKENSFAASKVNTEGVNLRKLEFEMVMRDYDKVIELDPKFVYAYYNRANVNCMQRNYDLALPDFNKAIELYPDFAEALFNRGLVYLYLGQNQKGIADLSKAGELGIISAYNILKRVSE
ncbi:MAG: tetratricopeptide repeat protein [Bacteroidales bacterium]